MTRRTITHGALALVVALVVPLAAQAGTTAAHGKATHETAKTHEHAKHMAMSKTDLNTATAEALAALPGMDQATAQKIIDNRPYKNPQQLVAKGIVTKEAFAKISRLVAARPAAAETHKPSDAGAKATPENHGSSEGETH